ncbi:MAG: hypothetical protein EHM13_01240 [Acidobacteria bacterium]|nr:MAG: hypothetical protein EHM13_01240 [Acidobacteriota bacterium]
MGFFEVSHALLRYRAELGLDPVAFAVLLSIMSHANGTDRARVAYSQISADTGYGLTAVKGAVKRLRAVLGERIQEKRNGDPITGIGLVEVSEARWVGKNRNAINEYNLVPLAERLKALVAASEDSSPTPAKAIEVDPGDGETAAKPPLDVKELFGVAIYSWQNDEPDEGELDEPTPFDGPGWGFSSRNWVGLGPVTVPEHAGEIEPDSGPWPVPALTSENLRQRDPTLTERVAALVRYLTRAPAQRKDLSPEELAGCFDKAVAVAAAKGPRFVARLMGGDSRQLMECRMRLENAVAEAFVWHQRDPTRGGRC